MEIVFAKEGIPRVSTRPMILKKEGATLTPILYFKKAKNATESEFNDAVNFLIRQAEKTMKNNEKKQSDE